NQEQNTKALIAPQQQSEHRRNQSSDLKRLFFKPKRHSVDYSAEQLSSIITPPLSPTTHGSRIISTIEAKFKTEVMTQSLTSQLQQREARYQRRLRRRRFRHGHGDGIGAKGSHGRLRSGNEEEEEEEDESDDNDQSDDEDYQSESESQDEEGVWRKTMWIQLPGPAEVATFTETKHIVKKHTLQLILLCGLVGDTTSNNISAEAGHCPGSGGSSNPIDRVITQPGVNKEFRLEMDLHVTGPRAPA
ncbi:hypothetical protein BGZ65_011429, partial [Modicella reniformis]